MEHNSTLGINRKVIYNQHLRKIEIETKNSYHFQSIYMIFQNTFMPINYPFSVRQEYLSYQFWDSLQAFCSYIRNVLTSKAILVAVGVGNAEASALSASLSWIIKDGIGILGSLFFAYNFSPWFEIYPKEWRFCADCLCNIGLLLQMLSSSFSKYNLYLSSFTAITFSCLGIAAGATKSRISAHLALDGHLADVNAKESTQETATTLLGMIFGYYAASHIGEDLFQAWILFIICTLLHLYCNRCLVDVLVFDTLNPQRAYIISNIMINNNNNSNSNSNEVDVDIEDENHKGIGNRKSPRLRQRNLSKKLNRTASSNANNNNSWKYDNNITACELLDVNQWACPHTVAQHEQIFGVPVWLSLYGPRLSAPISAILQGLNSASNTSSSSSSSSTWKKKMWTSLNRKPAWTELGVVIGWDRADRLCVCYSGGGNDEEKRVGKGELFAQLFMICCLIMHRRQQLLTLNTPVLMHSKNATRNNRNKGSSDFSDVVDISSRGKWDLLLAPDLCSKELQGILQSTVYGNIGNTAYVPTIPDRSRSKSREKHARSESGSNECNMCNEWVMRSNTASMGSEGWNFEKDIELDW